MELVERKLLLQMKFSFTKVPLSPELVVMIQIISLPVLKMLNKYYEMYMQEMCILDEYEVFSARLL